MPSWLAQGGEQHLCKRSPLLKKRRELGVKTIAWLDDIIFVRKDKDILLRPLQQVLDDLSMIELHAECQHGAYADTNLVQS